MITYSNQLSLFQTLTNNTSTANASLASILLNQADAEVINTEEWDFLETTRTTSTVASQQYYGLPYDIDRIKSVVVVIGTTQYLPKPCPSRDYWNYLNESTNVTSDTPEYYYITENTIGIYPTPAGANTNALKIVYSLKRKDLSLVDYSTGNIVTATNGQVSIVGSGTSWTSKMAGFWLKITDSQATNTGDGYWYQIDTVASATTLNLKSPYGGASIAAGSAVYIIGQTSLIPEDFQLVPVYRAVEVYYSTIQPDSTRASEFKSLFTEGIMKMRRALDNKISSPVIDYGMSNQIPSNPNLYISL